MINCYIILESTWLVCQVNYVNCEKFTKIRQLHQNKTEWIESIESLISHIHKVNQLINQNKREIFRKKRSATIVHKGNKEETLLFSMSLKKVENLRKNKQMERERRNIAKQ